MAFTWKELTTDIECWLAGPSTCGFEDMETELHCAASESGCESNFEDYCEAAYNNWLDKVNN